MHFFSLKSVFGGKFLGRARESKKMDKNSSSYWAEIEGKSLLWRNL